MTLSHPIGDAATDARALTDRIKVGVEAVWELVKQAWDTRAWDTLGYASWDDYCTREFGTSRLRLPREDRQDAVASMREIGMSTRAIASATGTSYDTVQRDLRADRNLSPDPEVVADYTRDVRNGAFEITGEPIEGTKLIDTPESPEQEEPVPLAKVVGLDGKTYNPTPATTRQTRRPALPGQFGKAAGELDKVVARIERLQVDSRFRTNKASISDQCVPQIRRAVEVLQDLLDTLGEDDGDLT